ncbi:MAG TPA: hypothetical protein VFQ61_05340 [Polyangiaceae bacterium]|nr:hypothetical protein [Polyangiaceae bacterium]
MASATPGCSLIADASDIDQACEAGFKYCKDVEACVSYSDPGFGCALTSCEPCSATSSNQVMGCVRGRCEVVACTTQGDCRQGM